MVVSVVNWSQLKWEPFEGGVRFAAQWADLSRCVGLRKLGCGVWIVPPGRASVVSHAATNHRRET